MICKVDESQSFARRMAGELPTVESEMRASHVCQDRAVASERVFPPSLSEQTASATDRHDFGTRAGENW